MQTKVTIIGLGTMGKVIAKALWKNSRMVEVFGIDKNNIRTAVTRKNIGKSNFVILAVKPQNAEEAIGQIKIHLDKNAILISIMAGVSIKKLAHLSGHKKIIRMMPNLGLSIDRGIAVWKKFGLSRVEAQKAKNFVNKITENFEVQNEDTINKVTAISGSGPAYFFLLADYLIEAGCALGLKKSESRKLVQKTFSASAILSENSNYSDLMKKIASKGGTTEAALKVFQKKNLKTTISEAVRAAYQRAKKLNNG